MPFFAFGLNQECAPLAVREAFALDARAASLLYETVRLSEDSEWMLLSTCNRTEVYLYGSRADVAAVQAALEQRAGAPWPLAHAFLLQDDDALRHVLQVAAGLRSSVLGDAQILGQVKEAYRLAAEAGRVSTLLHRLLHTAFRTAKQVVTETRLVGGTTAVSSAAVAAARRFLAARHATDLSACRVLVVGAGRMARLALEALQPHAPARLTITNRTPEHARRLAAAFEAGTVSWAARHRAAAEADLVIVASASATPILRAPLLDAAPAGRLVIDLALPRNVEPAVDALPGYTVLDLDGLQDDLDRTEASRRAAVPAAEALCEAALEDYEAWVLQYRALQPVIHAVADTFEAIRHQEVDRHAGRLSTLERTELDRLTRSILQKLIAIPVVRLKDSDPDSLDFARSIRLLYTLFARPDCEETASSPLDDGDRLSRASVEGNATASQHTARHAAWTEV